ncbi:MAG TPA: response regulator transcription factor [Dissulfurispiraceae bacterium]|nr:response regulator transcription factor [Dissulfurispiraceae bacterium]
MNYMINILIVDDHAVVRAGLRQIISGVSDMTVADEADSAFDALDKIRKKRYSMVVLDISMPGKSGLDVLKEIRSEHPKLPVLMLSMYPEDQYAVRALRSGASGYMTKDSAPNELVTAIRTVAGGRKYISSDLAERLAFNLDVDMKKEPHEILSDREYQVLCTIASGKTISEIADQLSLSVKTISTYRSRILEKMQLKNNAELTNYAIRNHLVD